MHYTVFYSSLCNFRSLSVDLNEKTSCRNVFGTLNSVYGSPLLQAKIPLQQKILLATVVRLADDSSSTIVEKGLCHFELFFFDIFLPIEIFN